VVSGIRDPFEGDCDLQVVARNLPGQVRRSFRLAPAVSDRRAETAASHATEHSRVELRFAREARVVSRCVTETSPGEDGRCPARTGDLLLVRRELLRSAAVCRFHSASTCSLLLSHQQLDSAD
jgi:hypothetical protein